MAHGVHLGRVGDVPVGAHWSVLVISGLIASTMATGPLPSAYPGHTVDAYWASGLVIAIAFQLAIVTHEMGHVLVARRQGCPVEGITLWLFGGVTRAKESATPGDALRLAVAGPAVTVMTAALCAGVALALDRLGAPVLVVGVMAWLARINLILAAVNLIPATPLDGGRMLQAAIWRIRGDRLGATVTAARAGRVCGSVLIGVGILGTSAGVGGHGFWVVCLGGFLLMAARAERVANEARLRVDGVRLADVMTRQPVVGPGWVTVEAFLDEYARHQSFSSFPVARFDGHLDGLVTLKRLKEVPRDQRSAVRVLDVAWRIEDLPVARSDSMLLDVVSHMSRCGAGRALVIDEGRLVGIVSPADVARALRDAPNGGGDS